MWVCECEERDPPTYSYPYQTNTVLIGPSHHGTRTIVQPCWPLSLTPVSSATWHTVWSVLLAYQKARLSAFNVVTYKEDKIINFINFILRVADRCSHKSLAHPLRCSLFFFFQEGEMPAGLSSLKGRENKNGAVVREQEECENTARWRKYKCWAQRNQSPVSPCAPLQREREKHEMGLLHSAQVVLFAPIDSYTITKGEKFFEPNTASSWRNFEFLISDTVPSVVLSGQLSPSIQRTTHCLRNGVGSQKLCTEDKKLLIFLMPQLPENKEHGPSFLIQVSDLHRKVHKHGT